MSERCAAVRTTPAPRPALMTGTSRTQFGFLIAYILPGFIALAGFVPLFPVIGNWLQPVSSGEFDLGLGPPLYAVLAALALGQVLSCFRWILIDQTHQWMGVTRPTWEDGQLDQVLGAFDYLVQSHYRYAEFCGNTLLALLWAYGVNRALGTLPALGIGTDVGLVVVAAVLFAASRSALTNYYTRTRRLIGAAGADLETQSCTMGTTTAAGTKTNPNLPQHPSSSRK